MRDAREATLSWVPLAVDAARERGFEQVDLDDLLGGEPEMAVQVALVCLSAASDYLNAHDETGLRAFLAVPMADAEHLDVSTPDISALQNGVWKYGPGRSVPGLYVARLDNLHWDEVDEEYRRRLSASPPEWYVEYRTWRLQEQATAGWEYGRAAYFWRTS